MNFFKERLRGISCCFLLLFLILSIGALQSGLTWSYFILALGVSIFMGVVADKNKTKGTKE